MLNSDESTALLNRNNACGRVIKTGLEWTVCAVVALPTSVLNSLAGIVVDVSEFNSLQSPEDLWKLLCSTTPERISYGIIIFLGSETVLFFLNKKYLFSSLSASADLLRRSFLTLKSYLQNLDIENNKKASIVENILFLTSAATSLIFAEIGGKAFSFMKMPGIIIGFSLSLIVYFATRFSGARYYFKNLFDTNIRLKKSYIHKLEILKPNFANSIEINDSDVSIDEVLSQFLLQIDSIYDIEQFESIPRKIFLQYISQFSGYSLGLISILPITSVFIPEAVQGTEMLLRVNIGANSHYQNVGSFILGAILTVLTLFFYEINIKELPKHFLRTGISIFDCLQAYEYKEAFKLLGLTLVAIGFSYFTSVGFGLIASSAVHEGFLSYLGYNISALIPVGLVVAVTAMLWSHLQDLINQTHSEKLSEVTYTQINRSTALTLLKKSETNIAQFLHSNPAVFFSAEQPRLINEAIIETPSKENKNNAYNCVLI